MYIDSMHDDDIKTHTNNTTALSLPVSEKSREDPISETIPELVPEAMLGEAGWVGRRVKSWDSDGTLTGKGTIIRVIKKGKGGKKWEVKWDDEYNFFNGK